MELTRGSNWDVRMWYAGAYTGNASLQPRGLVLEYWTKSESVICVKCSNYTNHSAENASRCAEYVALVNCRAQHQEGIMQNLHTAERMARLKISD